MSVQIMNNRKMLYYDRIGISEEIDVNKTSKLEECHIWHYWYFLNEWFKFQMYVCNTCHYELSRYLKNLFKTSFLKIENADYHCIITGISKGEAIKSLQNINFTQKNGSSYKNNIKSNFEAVNLLQTLI